MLSIQSLALCHSDVFLMMKVKRILVLLFTLAFTATTDFFALAQSKEASSSPNILFIVSDDYGWGGFAIELGNIEAVKQHITACVDLIVPPFPKQFFSRDSYGSTSPRNMHKLLESYLRIREK